MIVDPGPHNWTGLTGVLSKGKGNSSIPLDLVSTPLLYPLVLSQRCCNCSNACKHCRTVPANAWQNIMDPRAAAAGRVQALARHLQVTQLNGSSHEVSEQTSSGVALSACSSAVRRTLPRFDSNVLANYIDDLRSMKNEVYEVRLQPAQSTACQSCVRPSTQH